MLELKTELNKPISSEIQDRMNGIWNLGHVRLSNQLKEYCELPTHAKGDGMGFGGHRLT